MNGQSTKLDHILQKYLFSEEDSNYTAGVDDILFSLSIFPH